jgi:uroporphyrin-3 C-methyltransferase
MDEQREPTSAARPASRGGGRAFAVLALLLALASAAGAAWLWTEQQASRSALARLEQALARVPAPAPDRSDELRAQADAARAAIDALAARASALEEAQRALQASVAERTGADTRIAEAEYLLRLAAQSLLMGREVRGAIALLEASDGILRELDDPVLHEARAVLARDLGALRTVAAVDVEGTWLRLATLSAGVQGLVLAERRTPGGDTARAAPAGSAGWIDRALALLERFVVIRRDAAPVAPLPEAVDEQMLRTSVRLALEQAKLALLAAEPAAYAGALDDAARLVRGRFDPAAAANRAFLEELARLAGEQIAPSLPDLSGALRALREAGAARSDAG